MQIFGFERPVKLEPAFKKFFIELDEPSLEDNRSDSRRLLDALTRRASGLRLSKEVLFTLSRTLRSSSWSVTAVIWYDNEVLSVEPKDTRGSLYGCAVDIGTSKIVSYLVDLRDGKVVAKAAVENPQIRIGEELISRIEHALKPEGLKELHELTVLGVNQLMNSLCNEAGIESKASTMSLWLGIP